MFVGDFILEEEIWKQVNIKDLEKYEVSTYGRLRNRHGKILKIQGHSVMLNPTKFSKRVSAFYSVSYLVAQTFLPNPNNYSWIAHLDGNEKNHFLSNIEWGLRYFPKTYLLENKEVTEIRIQKYSVLINPEDYDRIKEYTWYVRVDKKKKQETNKIYFFRGENLHDEKRKKRQNLSSFILGIENFSTSGYMVDHINRNTLDNRKENLRATNNANNTKNRSIQKNNTTGFKGVAHNTHKGINKYQARIFINSKNLYLGSFPTPEEAHEAYKQAALKYFGEFANLD